MRPDDEIPLDVRLAAVAKVEVALLTGRRDAALQAIYEAFTYCAQVSIDRGSHVVELGIDLRIANLLEAAGIATVGCLIASCYDDLLRIANCGDKQLAAICEALERAGFALRETCD